MIKKVLYYQRRRLSISVALGMCYIAAWDICAALIGAFPLALQIVAVALLSAALVLPFYLLVMIRQPPLVARIDALFTSLFPFSILALVAPAFDPIGQGGAFGVFALALSVAFFQWMFCGPMLDRFTMRDLDVLSFTFNVNVTPAEAWRALVPSPDHQNEYMFKGTRFMNNEEEDDENSWTVSLIDQPWAVHQINRITMNEKVPGSYFHFDFDPVQATGAIANLNGWFALTFAPSRNGTTNVQIEMQLHNVPIRYRVFWYMGDAFQVYMRILRATVQKQIIHTAMEEPPAPSALKAQPFAA